MRINSASDWWNAVDRHWPELLAICDRVGLPTEGLHHLRTDRDPELAGKLHDAWFMAPDSPAIHLWPGWHVLCDLCSERDVLYEGEPEPPATWAARTASVQPGDTVAYSRRFLQSISCFTGDMPQGRGTVKELQRLGEVTLAVIDWGGMDLPEKVNVRNLSRVKDGMVMDHD